MEQDDKNLFNRAKLINIGAKIANLRWQEKCIADNDTKLCIVSHDIDMLPLNQDLQYTCENSPKLLASAAEQFKYGMPYENYFGGVVAISWNHLKIVNGLTNR